MVQAVVTLSGLGKSCRKHQCSLNRRRYRWRDQQTAVAGISRQGLAGDRRYLPILRVFRWGRILRSVEVLSKWLSGQPTAPTRWRSIDGCSLAIAKRAEIANAGGHDPTSCQPISSMGRMSHDCDKQQLRQQRDGWHGKFVEIIALPGAAVNGKAQSAQSSLEEAMQTKMSRGCRRLSRWIFTSAISELQNMPRGRNVCIIRSRYSLA